MQKIRATEKTYSFLWNKEKQEGRLPEKHHYNKLQEVVPFSIVQGSIGIDAGCGNGYDLRIMAKKHPAIHFIGVDISDGIFNARRACNGLSNVSFVKASLLSLPFKEKIFDFAYSFGAIHHTPDPQGCFMELSRALNLNSKLIVYLYEKHEKNLFKRCVLALVRPVRLVTTRMPKKLLFILCAFLSPIVFILFSVPARVFGLFKATKKISDNVPFNFAGGPFSLTGDLYDRFGAPIEHRYSLQEVRSIFEKSKFYDIEVTKISDTAGWVAWGRT